MLISHINYTNIGAVHSSYKWYRYLFWLVIDVSLCNGFILYNHYHFEPANSANHFIVKIEGRKKECVIVSWWVTRLSREGQWKVVFSVYVWPHPL